MKFIGDSHIVWVVFNDKIQKILNVDNFEKYHKMVLRKSTEILCQVNDVKVIHVIFSWVIWQFDLVQLHFSRIATSVFLSLIIIAFFMLHYLYT